MKKYLNMLTGNNGKFINNNATYDAHRHIWHIHTMVFRVTAGVDIQYLHEDSNNVYEIDCFVDEIVRIKAVRILINSEAGQNQVAKQHDHSTNNKLLLITRDQQRSQLI